jgi:hypothetical protein
MNQARIEFGRCRFIAWAEPKSVGKKLTGEVAFGQKNALEKSDFGIAATCRSFPEIKNAEFGARLS